MPDWSARLNELAVAAEVPGAVLGIWQDGATTITPYGVLNTETGVETTGDSVFQIGSVSKPWTGTMIVQLAAEGRLQLDDPVVKLLPEAPIDPRITVRHLLTHTSGIDGDLFTDTGRGDDCLERYVALLADVEQLFEPGTAYSYCNAGFVVLGRLIEVLDGRAWDESLRARLVEPLGLTHTVTLPEEAILYRAARGHTAEDGSPVKTWQLPRSIGPAGLITASAADLLEFARMHLDDERYAAMQEPQVPFAGGIGGFIDLGLTWRIYDWDGRRIFGHDGSTISQTAFLRVDPDARLIMCLLTNSGNGTRLFEPLASEVFQHYVGVSHPAAPQPVDGPVDDRHVGRYERASVRLDVVLRGDRLVLTEEATGDRLAFAEEPVHEYDVLPTEPLDGDHFVVRYSPEHPWVPLTFTPTHLFTSGRVTPRR
ncbi:serine hydrolase domain-containing protein [Kribbella jiaozuonensis]|uniref:Beta-lactamase family protein n=1 Tax=Kribbella jiaozuonensis TaxID=2575441 RepID=A0A4U3M4R3_9ACTN|nr:serine hydrolase domain-containing protein [Kribbella jiaozuonensis]TKK79122.1 beta-lactamase family protein [Kribbella jiaozuonensis]TKK83192.1 beta-lactamase family protein [Kribbella jiaozuonensis]